MTDVGAPVHGVIALDLGPVINNLEYVFGFDQGTVALIVAETEPFGETAPVRVPDLELRQAGRVNSAWKIQPRQPRGFCSVPPIVEGQDFYPVTRERKPAFSQQRWAQRIVDAAYAVLIAHVGFSGEAQTREAGGADDAKSGRRVLVKVCQAVAAEVVQLVRGVVVAADVVLVAIKGLRSTGGKVRVIRRG